MLNKICYKCFNSFKYVLVLFGLYKPNFIGYLTQFGLYKPKKCQIIHYISFLMGCLTQFRLYKPNILIKKIYINRTVLFSSFMNLERKFFVIRAFLP